MNTNTAYVVHMAPTDPKEPAQSPIISWSRASIVTNSGLALSAWILNDGQRTVLTAVSPSYHIEAVDKRDRKRIAYLLANAATDAPDSTATDYYTANP